MKKNKTKKILIALDYDPTAQKVAEEGFSIATAMGAEVILLHVISDPVIYSSLGHITVMGFAGYSDIDTIALPIESIAALKKESLHFLDKSSHHLGDKTIQKTVVEGDCAESILKTAKSMKADIIVMGSHSKKWLENIIMGSVTEKVLRHTPIPLFIVPTKK